MEPISGLLFALGWLAFSGGIAASALWLDRRLRKEWSCVYEGRAIRVVARQNRKELYVDGQRVAAKTTLSGAGASLAWTFQAETGPPVALTAVVSYAGTAAPIVRILANGQWIGGDQQPSPPPLTAEPTDPRWAAARVLLADLHHAPDPRLREAAGRVEASLRDLLGRSSRLATARDAHATLGGAPDAIDGAHAGLDARIGELVDGLRQLHLAALAEAPAAFEPIDELLGRIAAEAEVASLDVRQLRRQAVTPG